MHPIFVVVKGVFLWQYTFFSQGHNWKMQQKAIASLSLSDPKKTR